MTLLAIDSTGPSLSVAIACEGKIVYECFQRTGHTHSERLMPMIDAALQAQGTEPSQLDALAVTVGPGSFTGVRIGVETAKALCHALEKPCVPVNALEAIEMGDVNDAQPSNCFYHASLEWKSDFIHSK